MSTKNVIDYRLPLTAARFAVTVAHTMFQATSGTPPEIAASASAEVALITVADPRQAMAAHIENRAWNDISGTIKLTDDQRLSSASSETSGVAGKVLAAVVKMGAVAGGILIGYDTQTETTDPDPYMTHNAEVAQRLIDYRGFIASATTKLASLSQQSSDPSNDAAATAGFLTRIRATEALRAGYERELQRELERKSAWLAARTTTRSETRESSIPVDLLPESTIVTTAGNDYLLDTTALSGAQQVWDLTGTTVTVDTVPSFVAPTDGVLETIGADKTDGVWIRNPRRVSWKVWRRAGENQTNLAPVVLQSVGFMNVVDAGSTYRFIRFRRSWWAKRTVAIEIGPNGALTSFTASATSTAAALATAAEDSLTSISDGLTSAQGIRTSIATLQATSATERLAQLTRQADTAEQQLRILGQDATSADYAELQRLTQAKEIAAAHAAIDPVTLAAASLTRETALIEAQQSATELVRELRAELTVEKLRSDIAALP